MEEIAAVYARSLFEVAQEQNKLDTIREQLGVFADALSDNRELQVFFFSPYFSTTEKEDGLDRAVSDAEPILVNFLKLLIENHRTPVIFRVRRVVDELWQQENKLLPVTVTSAVEKYGEKKNVCSSRDASIASATAPSWSRTTSSLSFSCATSNSERA